MHVKAQMQKKPIWCQILLKYKRRLRQVFWNYEAGKYVFHCIQDIFLFSRNVSWLTERERERELLNSKLEETITSNGLGPSRNPGGHYHTVDWLGQHRKESLGLSQGCLGWLKCGHDRRGSKTGLVAFDLHEEVTTGSLSDLPSYQIPCSLHCILLGAILPQGLCTCSSFCYKATWHSPSHEHQQSRSNIPTSEAIISKTVSSALSSSSFMS